METSFGQVYLQWRLSIASSGGDTYPEVLAELVKEVDGSWLWSYVRANLGTETFPWAVPADDLHMPPGVESSQHHLMQVC